MILRRLGNKSKLATKIQKHFPAHKIYIEPFFGAGGMFSSTSTIPVTGSAGWQHRIFNINTSDLVYVTGSGGTGVLNDTLLNVDKLLIRHDPGAFPSLPPAHPAHITATMGIDNIRAIELAWIFDNSGVLSFKLNSFEPTDVPFGALGGLDPNLLLYIGRRYKVTIINFAPHPFEVIAKAANDPNDMVLLSMASVGSFESDQTVGWYDDGAGTATFTLSNSLYNGMIVPNRRPGYRCGIHKSSMRGDFDICTEQIEADFNGDCLVDFWDFSIIASQWLDTNLQP